MPGANGTFTVKVPVESYVPMMMFAIVFGLSMDYEVIGRLNWWMPGWLDRILPRLEAGGHTAAQPAAAGAAR